ncbi:MAG: hypothetical protein K2L18_00555, partial [Acetatifactor sp.]|nr:hypothetical protein [Acetatifactor sp.]
LVQLYLYNGDERTAVWVIDPSVYHDVLEITGGYTLVRDTQLRTVAVYSYVTDSHTNRATLTITKENTEPIVYYRLEDRNGNCISGEELVSIEEPFSYLSLLVGDFSDIVAAFYDSSENLLYRGNFETGIARIVVEQSESGTYFKQHVPGKYTDEYQDASSGRIFITGPCACREHAELK